MVKHSILFIMTWRDGTIKNPSLLEIKLSQLKQIEREILLLYYVEDYSDPEIANTLGLSVVAIKKRRVRIVQRLKSQLFRVE